MPALVPPAVAKWHFVEEKARAVLDAYAHREVRPATGDPASSPEGVLAGNEDAALVTLAEAYLSHPSPAPAVARWYGLGPGFGPLGRPHGLTVALFGEGSVGALAELAALAMTVLRETELPPQRLSLTVEGDPSGQLSALLEALGERPQSADSPGASPILHLALARPSAPPLWLGTVARRDSIVAKLGGSVAALGWVLDLEAVVAALPEEDAGYLPGLSIVVAPAGPTALARALALAGRLRRGSIRTLVEHRVLAREEHLEAAAEAGARLLLFVGADDEAPLELHDLETRQIHPCSPDDLDLLVARLLD